MLVIHYYITMNDVRNVCRVAALFLRMCWALFHNQHTIPCLTHTYTRTCTHVLYCLCLSGQVKGQLVLSVLDGIVPFTSELSLVV